MNFIVDECVGPSVARWLTEKGYNVFSVYDQAMGEDDTFVLQKAIDENRILVTSDKDFGEMIFRDNWNHCGVILFRLLDERVKNKISKLELLLNNHEKDLENNFIVLTEKTIKITR